MFRKEVLESRKRKWHGKAILLRGASPSMVMSACLLFIFLFILFVTFASYTRRTIVSGEITTWPRPVNIYAGMQGFIAATFVSEGQFVSKGDPLYRLDISRSTSGGVVSDNQRRMTESQLARVDNIISRLKESKTATLNALKTQQLHYSEASKRGNAIITRAETGVGIMKKNMDNYIQYHSSGLINKDQLTNQIALYYQQQNNLLSLSSQNEQNTLQAALIDSQIQSQAAAFDNQIYQIELQRFELEKQLVSTDAEGEMIIRAPSAGKVDSISVTVGQMVRAGDSLLKITPGAKTSYYLVIWVPNDVVPYISVGDSVNIRYEAFPAEKFGQFAGKVDLISRVPALPQEMMMYQGAPKASLMSATPYYKVVVTPSKRLIVYQDKAISLENGMKAQITLFLGKRKIYQWMFSPFYDMKNSFGGPVHE